MSSGEQPIPDLARGGQYDPTVDRWRIDDFAGALTSLSDNTVTAYVSDVQQFAVYDASAQAAGPRDLVGYFYLDLFPRTGKYGHGHFGQSQGNIREISVLSAAALRDRSPDEVSGLGWVNRCGDVLY